MSTSRPLVPVVPATYNRSAFLPRAIDSALGQTLGDLEVIVADDGSTDDTPAVLDGFGDDRLRPFRRAGTDRLLPTMLTRTPGLGGQAGAWRALSPARGRRDARLRKSRHGGETGSGRTGRGPMSSATAVPIP